MQITPKTYITQRYRKSLRDISHRGLVPSTHRNRVKYSFNLNVKAGDEEKEEVGEVRRPMGMDRSKKKATTSSIPSTSSTTDSDQALARLMVTRYASKTESILCTTDVDDHGDTPFLLRLSVSVVRGSPYLDRWAVPIGGAKTPLRDIVVALDDTGKTVHE
ncbi:hypothetical protein Tco_0510897 [Tanacetum coccineum]